jgi:hypothetical protein
MKAGCRTLLLMILGTALAGCAVAPSGRQATETSTEQPFLITKDATLAGLSTPELIDAALQRGEISAEERILYLAYAIYEYESLPEAYRSNVPWRGTLVVEEINRATRSAESLCAFPSSIQEELHRLIPNSAACAP